jgi:hypothetical protein
MDIEVTKCEVGYIWHMRGLAVGPLIYRNELSGVIKGRKILYQFLKDYVSGLFFVTHKRENEGYLTYKYNHQC